MILLSNLKTTLILGGILLIIILAIVFSLSAPIAPPQDQVISTPQPTSFPNLAPPSIPPDAPINNIYNTYSQEYLEEQKIVDQEEQPLDNRALTVSKFVDTLPFTGQYIKVSYNIYNNQVYLEYDRNNKAAAVAEFADLLKKNNIENINWINNLQIIER